MAQNKSNGKKLIEKSGSLIAGTEPILRRSAQTTTLCDKVCVAKSVSEAAWSSIMNRTDVVLMDKALIEIQLLSGCRISQALGILPKNISQNGVILISGSKGSKEMVYKSSLYNDFWLSVKKNSLIISEHRDRFYMYRLYRKLGIWGNFGKSSKLSVTHSLRHALFTEMDELKVSKEVAAEKVGQRSLNSQNYYRPSLYGKK